jgi:Uma2 family endonuclease
MSMVVAIRRFTPEEYLALPDRDRFELVEGRLVEVPMSMLSSWVGSQVNRILGDFVVRNDLGWVFMADNLYRCFSDPGKFRKPDVSFIRRERMTWEQLGQGYATIPPDLAVEVTSPNDLLHEVEEKVQEYLDAGVRLVWVVNPDLRAVRVHRPNGTITGLRERDELSGEDVVPGFGCAVSAIFPPRVEKAPANA